MAVKSGKEWKIGLIVVVAILIFVFGLNFLIGKNIFSSENQYYAYYNNVQGLQESAVVQVSGMTVGRVSGIALQPDKRVKVSFTTLKSLKIPQGSVAKLDAADMISGTKIITLRLSNNSIDYADNATIPSEDFKGLMDNISQNVSPLLTSVQHTVVTIDTLISSVNSLFNSETQKHLSNSLASTDKALAQLAAFSKTLNEQSKTMAEMMQNLNSISANLAKNNNNISQTLGNINRLSGQLSSSKLDETLKNLQQTTDNLKSITEKINNDKGSLGLMLNDKKLYNNMTASLNSLNALLSDLKQHPAKYINVSVFGRKVK